MNRTSKIQGKLEPPKSGGHQQKRRTRDLKFKDINDKQNIIINENKELKETINKALTKASSLINYLMKNHKN
jgi:hypothetical protein